MHSALDLGKDEIDAAPVAPSKPKPPATPSDDPVLRELEESELEASHLKVSDQKESDSKASDLRKAAPNRRAPESAAPVFSSYQQKQKPRRSLVGLLILVLAVAGFYAAWIYEPGFREIAQPQIDRVLALAGMAHAHPQQSPVPVPVTNPAKPPAPLAPATTGAPAPESSIDPNQTPSAVPDAATSSAAATAPVAPPTVPVATVAPPTSEATITAAPVAIKVEASKPSDSKKDNAPAASSSSNAELPWESSVIILSSKGAEKRLAHSVPPKYPAEARSVGGDGTVVLKAVVDENGKVEGLRLVEGDAILATAAIQAVKQWHYRPYLRNGKAQPFQTVVIVDFQRP